MRASVVTMPRPKPGSQLERRAGVGDDLDRTVHVVCAPPVLRDDVAQGLLIGRFPVGDRALKERQRMPRKANGIGLVGGGDVDDAVAHLHVERTHLVGVDNTEAAALDHRRAAHADARVRRRDDQVGAAEERRVAGEASTRRDPDARHDAGEPRPERECHHVETGDHRVIGVARSPAAALGEEHDRQAAPLDHLEETVLLAMPHHALRAGEHRVVVGEHRAVRAILADQRAVHARGAGDEPVRRRSMHQVVDAAPAALRRDRQAAVLDEAALVAQVGRDSRARSGVPRVARGDDVAATLVANQAAAAECFREIGTRCSSCSCSGIR